MLTFSACLGLFVAAFLSATLLPLQSEAVLVGLLMGAKQHAGLLLLVATVGNVLGSLVNWQLGRHVETLRDRPWFPVRPERLDAARRRFQRWGHWSLLLSWAPVIGDPLTLVAGVLGEPFGRFLGIVTLAKGARYLVLTALTLGWMGG